VAGGVTAVFEMPNTKPLTTSPETLADKVRRARNRMYCDFAFYVGGTRENIDDIPDLEQLEGFVHGSNDVLIGAGCFGKQLKHAGHSVWMLPRSDNH
jgi:dihydroorotase-like cyclic amidohydrolase